MNNQKAVLRNGCVVVLTARGDDPEFPIMGRRFTTGELELWTKHGRYRADGTDHPLDITHLVTPSGKTVEFLGLVP